MIFHRRLNITFHLFALHPMEIELLLTVRLGNCQYISSICIRIPMMTDKEERLLDTIIMVRKTSEIHPFSLKYFPLHIQC